MKTLMFVLGFGIGAGVSSWITLLFVLLTAGKIRKNSFKEQEQFNKDTLQAMQERNALDGQKLAVMKEIAENTRK